MSDDKKIIFSMSFFFQLRPEHIFQSSNGRLGEAGEYFHFRTPPPEFFSQITAFIFKIKLRFGKAKTKVRKAES